MRGLIFRLDAQLARALPAVSHQYKMLNNKVDEILVSRSSSLSEVDRDLPRLELCGGLGVFFKKS
jgi:hypothetical protein